MDIQELRREIDGIDAQLLPLFCQRMEIAAQVADYKKENGLPIFVPGREREILDRVAGQAGEDMADYAKILYNTLFELSRAYQGSRNSQPSPLRDRVMTALDKTPPLFPKTATVACQGVEGAFSQIAAERIFHDPMILYFKDFSGVFQAVEQGLCRYGILPIENSTAGSVNQVYDGMVRHHFSIVRSLRLKVDHNLLAKEGSKLSGIREVFSHEQAIRQCSEFLNAHPDIKVTPVENTAVAAELVARSPRSDVAALCSHACEALYGLRCLAPNVQDQGNNHTRFICISRDLEIYPGSDRTSIRLVLDHKPGALSKVLSRLYVRGINVTKLESRPIPDRDFEFQFYFDLETSVYSPEFAQMLCDLEGLCQEFQYLGSYREVV